MTVVREARVVVTTKSDDGTDKSATKSDDGTDKSTRYNVAMSVMKQWAQNVVSKLRITDFNDGHRKLYVIP